MGSSFFTGDEEYVTLSDGYASAKGGHTHEFQGQKLVHDHQGGEQPHGYFDHPEDGSRATEARSTTPLYAVTREMVEELAKREVTDEEVARIRSSIEFGTVREAVEDAVYQVIDVPDDEEAES
jgi:hypothetical protein